MPPRRRRKYAVYYRERGARRWKRLHPWSQGSRAAIARIYQSWLLAPCDEEREIRPIQRRKI